MPKDMIFKIYWLVRREAARDELTLCAVIMGGVAPLPSWNATEVLLSSLSSRSWRSRKAGLVPGWRGWGRPGTSLVRGTVLWAEHQVAWVLYLHPSSPATLPPLFTVDSDALTPPAVTFCNPIQCHHFPSEFGLIYKPFE